jgi:hypothetical protein
MGYIPPSPATREGETKPITEGWWRRWPATTEDELMGYIPPAPQSRLAETRKKLREAERNDSEWFDLAVAAIGKYAAVFVAGRWLGALLKSILQ